jgi:sulfatase modifying factor 1
MENGALIFVKRIVFVLALFFSAATFTDAATYYVSSSVGNDSWTGLVASPNGTTGPWKTLAKASTVELAAGDQILLNCGDTWNEELHPRGNGTPDSPIVIGSYGIGGKPTIDREDYSIDRTGIRLDDQGGFKIVGIEFNRCMTGIYAEYSDECPTKKYIWVEDCYFHDSLTYQHYEDYPKRKIGLGICFFSFELDKRFVLTDITIKNCVFRRLASGVWTNSPDNFNKNASYVYNFGNMTMDGCLFEEGYQWQQGIRGVDTGVMRNCVTHDVGRNFRSFNGVAGSMFFRCKDWVFEDSEWGYVSIGLGSGDGEAFDFEGNCDNMIMRNCLFHDTDGPGFLLCCYASDGHAHTKIVMENCVINGKSKRPIGLPRCAIVNTTDWNESKWTDCRFYLSPGEALMRVLDPEKDKRTSFYRCAIKKLEQACSTPNLATQAKTSASSQVGNNGPTNVNDGEVESSWEALLLGEQWLQIEFPETTTVNEFRIKESASSSISRYVIQCWDEKTNRWIQSFNGMNIGKEFVAPIVARQTKKVRLLVKQTKAGNASIAEFEAYNDDTTTFSHDLLGGTKPIPRAAVDVVYAPVKPDVPTPLNPPTPPPTNDKPTNDKPVVRVGKSGQPETVAVGDVGNRADNSGFGAVAYEYRIGKYEVTNEQYCEFLNAVAKSDRHGLYDARMASDKTDENFGGIQRSGSSGDHSYSVKEGRGKRPVIYVSWESAIRYANWLTSGKTEFGSYTIESGSVKLPAHATLAAAKTACWVLPTENEWYKAAYYDSKKTVLGGYRLYPAKSDGIPKANLGSNSPADVGSFAETMSAYGTFDQGGNVWEYNESRRGNKVGLRGGSFYVNDHENYMRSTTRYDVLSAKWPNYGFRVALLGKK